MKKQPMFVGLVLDCESVTEGISPIVYYSDS